MAFSLSYAIEMVFWTKWKQARLMESNSYARRARIAAMNEDWCSHEHFFRWSLEALDEVFVTIGQVS